jgi:serine/threonine protein kinase
VESGNFLGSGMTARVKSLTIADREEPIAVKYLLMPTTKTLSVEGEYDMSHEVELVTDIEAHEREAGVGKRISLPHPLFYYKRGPLQCYGMEQIHGFTLEELTNETSMHIERKDAILRAIADRYATEESQKALYEEADAFVKAMHEVCLHGDIKFGNMMADEAGQIYIIDFGQAVTMNNMSDDTREQYENLQDMERQQVRISIEHLLRFSNAGRMAEAA